MISSLEGEIKFFGENFLIVKVGKIGFKVFVSKKTLEKIRKKDKIFLFTFLNLKERGIELYGFLEYQQLELFELLNAISGIGPKTALYLSSFGSLKELKDNLEKRPEIFKGIGKKKIQKIILELSGKIKRFEKETDKDNEVISALQNLGFSSQEIREALKQIPKKIKQPEEKIKEALKFLGKTK